MTADWKGLAWCLVAVGLLGCGSLEDQGVASPTPPKDVAPNSGAILVDFQPRGAPTGRGYSADTGEIFGDRGGGLSYGWTTGHADRARSFERPFDGLDARLWTLIEISGDAGPAWEIAVPNGSYLVTVVAGGPEVVGHQSVSVEGVTAIDVTPGDYAPWVKGTVTVAVSDGRLSLASATGAPATRLCSVDIVH